MERGDLGDYRSGKISGLIVRSGQQKAVRDCIGHKREKTTAGNDEDDMDCDAECV
jgi:hypothetical protein